MSRVVGLTLLRQREDLASHDMAVLCHSYILSDICLVESVLNDRSVTSSRTSSQLSSTTTPPVIRIRNRDHINKRKIDKTHRELRK
jgi:hypothetical protein